MSTVAGSEDDRRALLRRLFHEALGSRGDRLRLGQGAFQQQGVGPELRGRTTG